MKLSLTALLLVFCFVAGCGKKEEPKVQINMPGMNMKVDDKGVNINVPGK